MHFAQSRKPPEVIDRKIATGTFLLEELREFREREFRERKLRFKIFWTKPGFKDLIERTRNMEKQVRYAKIKGSANGIKGIINRGQITIALLLPASAFLNTKR
jgi:hypothetical protein